MSDVLTPEDVDRALNVRFALGGRERTVRMALRTAAEVVPDARLPHERSHEDLTYSVLDLIDTLDGEVPGLADAREICTSPVALAALLGARNRLWSDLRMAGRLLALCPHCGRRESSFGLETLALVLRHPPPPLFSADGLFLEVPALAERRPHGTRLAQVPSAARLRGLLPSGRLALEPSTAEAVLRSIDTEDGRKREAAAWDRWAPPDAIPPPERSHWLRALPGFRAILRLSVALESLDGATDVTPERVEALSLADFLFLDAAYDLTHHVDQPRPDALVATCEDCGGAYLPLA